MSEVNSEAVRKAQEEMIANIAEKTGQSIEDVRKEYSPSTVVTTNPAETIITTDNTQTDDNKIADEIDPPNDEKAEPIVAEAPAATDRPASMPSSAPAFLANVYKKIDESKTVDAEQVRADNPSVVTSAVNPASLPSIPRIGSSDLSLLDSLVVDLQSIEVVDSNLLQRKSFVEASLNKRAAYQVIALRSGYSASVSGLAFIDKDTIRNSQLDIYNERKKIYQIAFSKIVDSSVAGMTFSEFLKITAYDDFETILFGIYAQTYPEATPMTLTCGKCGHENKIKIYPTSFLKVHDEKVYSYINDVITCKYTAMELLKKSLVHSKERIFLPESKIIIDLKTPSLEDHLRILSRHAEVNENSAVEVFGCMVYIDKIFLPNVEAIKRTGRPVYSEVTDFTEGFNIICNLRSDADILNAAINKRERIYRVSYRIASVPCEKCKEDIGEVNVDIERLLLFQMEEARRQAEESQEEENIAPEISQNQTE